MDKNSKGKNKIQPDITVSNRQPIKKALAIRAYLWGKISNCLNSVNNKMMRNKVKTIIPHKYINKMY